MSVQPIEKPTPAQARQTSKLKQKRRARRAVHVSGLQDISLRYTLDFLRSRMGTKRGGSDKEWTWSLLATRSKDYENPDKDGPSGVSATTLTKWDRGETRTPQTRTVNAALRPFGYVLKPAGMDK